MTDGCPPSPPGLSLSPSGRELIIPTANPAREGKDVFVCLRETVMKLKELIAQATAENDKVIFIRAPVAVGKTTLANYLTTKHGDEFVKVASATSEDMWYQHVISASGEDHLQKDEVRKALMSIARQGKTIVIDEAHLIFSQPNVRYNFFKNMEDTDLAPRFLLFSASGSAADSQGKEVGTPSEIQRKYLWYPPNPDAEQLSVDLAETKGQPVQLDVDSVRFFVTLCGGHRGIFMRAMKWVQESQKTEPSNDDSQRKKITMWSIGDSVSHVRRTFEESRLEGGVRGWNVGLRNEFKKSRAVRVNGSFSDVQCIPKEFGLVLYGGPKFRKELNEEERRLTINGFLFPERQDTDQEFVLFDWQDSTVSYGVPNPIMAEYYGDILPFEVENYKRKLVEDKKIPDSAADLLARVLPYMTLTVVVGNPISRDNGVLSSCLSQKGLPYEDDYNGAIAEILRNHLKYMVATPRDEKLGKTDIVVSYNDHSTCAIESIMAWQAPKSHVEHAERFFNPKKPNYADSQQKALLIIGDDRQQVKGRIRYVAEQMKDKEGAPPQLIGLRVSLNHDGYEMYLEGATAPVFFVCDRVAKSLRKDDHGRFETAQICVFESDEGAPKKPRPST